MIKAYKQLSTGVMRMRFSDKVWKALPPHKNKWIEEKEMTREIPSEIVDFMNSTTIPDEIIEISHVFPEEFKTEEDDNKTLEDGKPKRGRPKPMGNNEGTRNSPKVRGRKKR